MELIEMNIFSAGIAEPEPSGHLGAHREPRERIQFRQHLINRRPLYEQARAVRAACEHLIDYLGQRSGNWGPCGGQTGFVRVRQTPGIFGPDLSAGDLALAGTRAQNSEQFFGVLPPRTQQLGIRLRVGKKHRATRGDQFFKGVERFGRRNTVKFLRHPGVLTVPAPRHEP